MVARSSDESVADPIGSLKKCAVNALMRTATDPQVLERTFGGKRFYIHHGDGLLKNDTGYRILKAILRNRVNMFLFSLVHPTLTGRIARWSSRTSRGHVSKRSFEQDGMTEFAQKKIQDGYDYVIMGHNHSPVIRNIGKGLYVNLGDWISENTYAVFDGTALKLKTWPAKQTELP